MDMCSYGDTYIYEYTMHIYFIVYMCAYLNASINLNDIGHILIIINIIILQIYFKSALAFLQEVYSRRYKQSITQRSSII